jgi:hypothetical protein
VPSLHTTFDRAPRFVLLLVLILMDLMLAPLLAATPAGLRAAQFLSAVMMVAALWAAGVHRPVVALFVPTLLAQTLAVLWGGEVLTATALFLRIAFFGYTTGLIMWRTLREAEVSLDTIAGAACAYTLLAVVWASMYLLLEFLHPGSFHIPEDWLMGAARDPSAALVYFSFVTLTTVGYGDITPAWAGAGGLAVSEAIVGQLYLAITVARLVGLHTSGRG